jgi:hypothetical protein
MKKEYKRPVVETRQIEPTQILAASGEGFDTGTPSEPSEETPHLSKEKIGNDNSVWDY